eukprot:scaffold10798_cov169-Ochromonas_danica.AAC.1
MAEKAIHSTYYGCCHRKAGVGATVPTLSKLGLIPLDGNAAATILAAVGELADIMVEAVEGPAASTLLGKEP